MFTKLVGQQVSILQRAIIVVSAKKKIKESYFKEHFLKFVDVSDNNE